MRVLFTLQPADGHFHPLVPLARALQAAGHEVAFACGRPYCPTVRATGFRCFPAGLDHFAFAHARAGRMVSDLLAINRASRADVIVRDVTEFGGCIAADRLGIPHASIQVGAHCPPEPPWQLIGPELAAWRTAAGRTPWPAFHMLYRYLHLAFVPPSYQRLGTLVPPTTHTFGPRIFDSSGQQTYPAWLDQLPRRPTIYVTLGTIVNARGDVFRAILEALRGEPVNLILTVGRDQDPAALGRQPPNVHVERYIPQSLVFPRCDLVISHGGFNTVIGALCHGLPMVLIPAMADQPENARRCAALGVGRVVEPGELRPASLRAAIGAVWHEQSYRRNAHAVRREVLALPGPEHAVALVERLVEERGPDRGEG
jgi:UDP:flavonoid glycosyltransferase YjiC (YdhE family)